LLVFPITVVPAPSNSSIEGKKEGRKEGRATLKVEGD